MIIVFDAGAFQQGIGGGILNVAIGFLNAAVKGDPSLRFIFLADPLFGRLRPEFMAKLTFEPEVVYWSVLKLAPANHQILTHEPDIHVIVDGVEVPFERDYAGLSYRGASPTTSFEIYSRASKPRDSIPGSTDPRDLGLAFTRFEVSSDIATQSYWFDDPRFDEAAWLAEDRSRWTRGTFRLPTPMLPKAATCTIRMDLINSVPYRFFDGRYDAMYRAICHRTELDRWSKGLIDLGRGLKRKGAEVYVANHFLPVIIPGLKLVTWAHDIAPIIHPQFFAADAIDNFKDVTRVMTRADKLLCISQFTRDMICAKLEIDASRLATVWIGASSTIYRRSESEVAALKTKNGIEGAYILCVGTLEPRKNHAALVLAYHELLKMRPDAPRLVVAGSRGWGFTSFFEAIQRFGLEDRVMHLEGLSDDELAALYSGATVLVYPSLFEGFGLPVLEAMVCGVPIVTSRGTSMEGIARGCCVFVDPTNPSSIAAGMRDLIYDSDLRWAMLDRAGQRVGQFDWNVIAANAVQEIRAVVQ